MRLRACVSVRWFDACCSDDDGDCIGREAFWELLCRIGLFYPVPSDMPPYRFHGKMEELCDHSQTLDEPCYYKSVYDFIAYIRASLPQAIKPLVVFTDKELRSPTRYDKPDKARRR